VTNQITKLQILGKNIQKFRKKKKLSQNELAELLGISREHLAKIETAKRFISLKLLFRLADILEVKEKVLFDFEFAYYSEEE
jgi:transcriptional regulator with XRE-family HTH domain